jgi:hypothetical protein
MDSIAITITLPADMAAQLMGLIADLRTTVPAIQGDVKKVADAVAAFHGTGPLGTKFGTQP